LELEPWELELSEPEQSDQGQWGPGRLELEPEPWEQGHLGPEPSELVQWELGH
jgi:hypothetical protein